MLLLALTAPPSWAQQADYLDAVNALLFGELGYREREHTGDDGLAVGQIAGQINYAVNQRFSLFSEVTLTSRQDQGLNFEVERLSARYDFSDLFKLSAGRYHTPVGYWNAAFHHGSWLQTTIDRPQTMRFGSHIVPIHFVGALLEGRLGDTSFNYRVGAGNGRSADEINDAPDAEDAFDDPAYLFSGFYRSHGKTRFEAGVTSYFDEPVAANGLDVDERLVNAYLVLLDESPELIVEYTYADHDSSASDGKVHSAYAQLAYRLADGASNFKPYVRAEDIDVDDSDPLLGGTNQNYTGYTAGLRWDFSTFAALKAEVRREKFGNRSASHGIWLQLSLVHHPLRRQP